MTSLSHIQDILTTAKYPVKQDDFYLKVQITFIPAFSHWGCRSTHLFLHFFKFTVHLCHFAYYFLERLFRSIWRWNNIRTFSQSETKSHFTKWKKSWLNRSFPLPLLFVVSLISPNNVTLESQIKVMRIKEVIINKKLSILLVSIIGNVKRTV